MVFVGIDCHKKYSITLAVTCLSGNPLVFLKSKLIATGWWGEGEGYGL